MSRRSNSEELNSRPRALDIDLPQTEYSLLQSVLHIYPLFATFEPAVTL